jgi:hypothetical protein
LSSPSARRRRRRGRGAPFCSARGRPVGPVSLCAGRCGRGATWMSPTRSLGRASCSARRVGQWAPAGRFPRTLVAVPPVSPSVVDGLGWETPSVSAHSVPATGGAPRVRLLADLGLAHVGLFFARCSCLPSPRPSRESGQALLHRIRGPKKARCRSRGRTFTAGLLTCGDTRDRAADLHFCCFFLRPAALS